MASVTDASFSALNTTDRPGTAMDSELMAPETETSSSDYEITLPTTSPPSASSPTPMHSTPSKCKEEMYVGQEFVSFASFKSAMLRWAVSCDFKHRYQKSDRQKNVVVCADKACDFEVRASWKQAIQGVEVTVAVPTHTTCLGTSTKRLPVNNHTFLREAVPEIMTVGKNTTPNEVIAAVMWHYNQKMKYQAAHRVVKVLQEKNMQTEMEEFRQLPQYVRIMRKLDTMGEYFLDVEEGSNRFQRIFVCPEASRSCFINSPPMIVLDSTLTTSNLPMPLLVAVCPDPNNEVALLAWAVADEENEVSWRFFCERLALAIPELRSTEFTLITNHEKGLPIDACDNAFPKAIHGYCCQSIAAKVEEKFGGAPRDAFWKLAEAEDLGSFRKAMDELKELKSPSVGRYIEGIGPASLWARHLFPGSRFGLLNSTGSFVEIACSIHEEAWPRERTILRTLQDIYHSTMHQRYLRLKAAKARLANHKWAPWGTEQLQESCHQAYAHDVRLTPNGSRVRATTTHFNQEVTFTVDLEARTCSCMRFQDTGVPCEHAASVIYRLKQVPGDWVAPYLERTKCIEAYSKKFHPTALDSMMPAQSWKELINGTSPRPSSAPVPVVTVGAPLFTEPPMAGNPLPTKRPKGRPSGRPRGSGKKFTKNSTRKKHLASDGFATSLEAVKELQHIPHVTRCDVCGGSGSCSERLHSDSWRSTILAGLNPD